VSQTQGIAMRPAVTSLVLDQRIRQLGLFLREIPVADHVASLAAPRVHLVEDLQEVEQVGSDTRNLGQRVTHHVTNLGLAVGKRIGQDEQCRVVGRSAACKRNIHCSLDEASGILFQSLLDTLDVVQGQLALGDVVRSLF